MNRTIEPDPFVQTALQLLPIPPHREGFWDDLEVSLAGGASAVAPARPTTVSVLSPRDRIDHLDVDDALALVPVALRRRSNAVLVGVAAAAAVIVVFAGVTLVRDRTDTAPTDLASGDAPSGELDALVDEAHPESSTPSTLSDDHEDASSQAVAEWVGALQQGDADAAWEAMGPVSQEHFATRAVFDEQLTSMTDGFGGWSEVDPDEVLVTPVVSSEDGTLAVVTLVGTTEVDGVLRHRAAAFPVRLVGDEVRLEPFAFAGDLEVVVPEPIADGGVRPPVEAGEELVIVVPSGADAPVLRLDDGATMVCGQSEGTDLAPLDGLPSQRCSYRPTAGISPGEHTLTVAFLGSDGVSISADALLFEAA